MKTGKPKSTNPLADLDMSKPFSITKEQAEEIVRKVKASMPPERRPRCRNGLGCPMCWHR